MGKDHPLCTLSTSESTVGQTSCFVPPFALYCRQLRACSTQMPTTCYPLSRELLPVSILCQITRSRILPDLYVYLFLYAVKQTLRTLALLPLLDLLTFEPSPNARTRIEVSRLDIRKVESRTPLWWLHSLFSQVACLYGRKGRRNPSVG
jgi:hypothetical protein